MKIYTKTGDQGTTGLFAGPRVSKDHPRIAAYGAVDELCAVLGIVLANLETQPASQAVQEMQPRAATAELLKRIQGDLFSMGAELATPDPQAHNMCLLTAERIQELEEAIDRAERDLPALTSFILPGGSPASAGLHLARTVCRRAEREVVQLTQQPDVHDCSRILVYLNRLGDLLFVLARQMNAAAGQPDITWQAPRIN